ncbi:DUF2796 domain-containing protein [Sulfitobacter aestuarii]|uniref:DUF2796 domain-containing protein n=1 Tax=Sulfitobacter aestuarii TaxID=2161676 RepID=A0ABW5U750_9RHOB
MALVLAIAASPVMGQEHRQLGAHEHGVGKLNIAFDSGQIFMEMSAPGADIVGFEHAPESARDRATVNDAVARLAQPLDLFALSEDAGCSVAQAKARFVTKENKEHDSHDVTGEKEISAAGHAEFHAEYSFTCSDFTAFDQIVFTYFTVFPKARELDIQLISEKGAWHAEISREAPVLDLRGRTQR